MQIKFEPGQIYHDVSIAPLTSWQVGGRVKQLYCPRDKLDLCNFLSKLPADEHIIFLGLGSNLLIRDAGLDASIVLTQPYLSAMEIEGTQLYAEAGAACAKVARYSARSSLTGIEFFAGIPGTVGGALAMNAGCFQSETWDFVHLVETVDKSGQRYQRSPEEFVVRYREVSSQRQEWFLSVVLQLQKGEKKTALSKIRSLIDQRAATQPTHLPSCGSVFRNPEGLHAARLIESCGLKGFQMGGAQISTKHANFIVNKGGATAQDIERLIGFVEQEVFRIHAVNLVKEVHILGEEGH